MRSHPPSPEPDGSGSPQVSSLENHFERFRRNIVGCDQTFASPFGEKRIVYADWTASGRLYAPIERRMVETFGPMVGNTHSETSVTGTCMTMSYHFAHQKIKEHVHAGKDDVIITAGFGMTTVVNKFQRMLGLKAPEQLVPLLQLEERHRPVVFVTHMEHHSNHTTWLETLADVVVIPPDEEGLVDLQSLERMLQKYEDRELKLGAFTACSNVTGISTPVHDLARIMHAHGGYCFVDFAASAPYVEIDMHPPDPAARLDAIAFSPHKFLGGPGSSGVLIFDSGLYKIEVPDQPGGGTVEWTNPWGKHRFVSDIEAREDGGTPGFLQAIRTALCLELKNAMGTKEMRAREEEMLPVIFRELRRIPNLHLLADNVTDRLAIVSFYVDGLHYNLLVKLLNDRFGIQVRGGCSCAGTYGHYLLHVGRRWSKRITDRIDEGDLSEKPGWVRLSVHPTTTDEELAFLLDGIRECVTHAEEWGRDYAYDSRRNEFRSIRWPEQDLSSVQDWFRLG